MGTISIPVSIAWVFVHDAARSRDRPRWQEIVRVLLVEAFAIQLLAVMHVSLGSPYKEMAPEWTDVGLFLRTLLIISAVSFVLAFAKGWTTDGHAQSHDDQLS